MARLREGTVGILPAGALGVAFFFHLTRELSAVDGRVFFLERRGSASSHAVRAAGTLHIGDDLLKADVFAPDLLGCLDEARLPELLLVCTQPDQLLGVIAEW